jgi:hypothetical protein
MDDQRAPQLLENPPRPRPTDVEARRIRATVMAGVVAGVNGLAAGVVERPRVRRSRVAVLVTAAAAATVAVAVVLVPRGGSGAAEAATPDVLAYEIAPGHPDADLADLVARVAAVPAEPRFTDSSHRAVSDSWSLSTRIDGQQIASAVVPEHRDLTWQADGSGRLEIVTGPPVFPTAESRRAWEEDGRPAESPVVITDEDFAVGEYDPSFPAVLPTDAGQLLALIKAGHPIDKLGTAELFIAVGDLYREQTPAPQVRAALLQLIDRATDVDDLGQVQDRQGRAGRGVAVTDDFSGLDTRYVMTFDDGNGALLSFEQVLVGDVGRLDVASPSVISYELFDQDASN